MDEKKVTAVRDWPTPTTVKELQRFLGFANFYRRFIRGYSSVTSPLTNLLRNKPKTLVWTPAATHAFQTLKQAFTTAPLLVHPDPELPFIVEVNASTTGVGAVLSQQQGNPQKLHPCAFFSRKLNPAEVNYDIGNRELLAVKLALEEWRHWLEGAKHPFTVLTDHKNLEYLRAAKRLNPARPAGPSSSRGSSSPSHTAQGQRTSRPMPCPGSMAQTSPAMIQNPFSPRKSSRAPSRGQKTRSPRQTLHQVAHRGCSSFRGRTAPPSYTPRMSPWVLPIRGSKGPSRSSNNVSGGPAWQWMSRDTFRDAGSAPCLRAHVGIMGSPRTLSRTGGHSSLPESGDFFKCLGVTISLSSGYHPQTNGQTERKIQEICRFLRTFCHSHQESWSQFLGWAEYAQNSLRQSTTGLTPFQCVLG
ncbi:hypothetical protein QTP70_006078 [Hemibagrus guttatus]|uniref:Integrase catalytic domain-containing protein n=1 Tax=Hemibagrus guttatus TaxID=175788 RepID=A0AAE0USI4_9TELE|nr:hypothetical protein QTP70_006078 [Hemibagrus guttatus]